MTVLDLFKKHKTYIVKPVSELPSEIKYVIWNLRPAYTLLNINEFINLYSAIIVDNVLYLRNIEDRDKYLNNTTDTQKACMVEFIYSTKNMVVLKNRFGGYSNYRRLVFLDVDGVLSSIPFLNKGKGLIDPKNIKILNKLKDINVEIVISSTWGEDAEKPLKELGFELPIIGYTEHFHVDYLCRGNEIEKWLHDNMGGMCTKYGLDYDGVPYYRKHFNENDTDYEYVILDDDTDFLLGQKDNFIHINEQTGLTDDDVEKARKILTRSLLKED